MPNSDAKPVEYEPSRITDGIKASSSVSLFDAMFGKSKPYRFERQRRVLQRNAIKGRKHEGL